MSRRILAISFGALRVELAKARSPSSMLAVVVSREGLTCEVDLSGGIRLDEVSPEAMKLGIRAGMTIASARARAASLRVLVISESAVEASLARIAEIGMAFGRPVSFNTALDIVWIDLTGASHLHASEEDPSGERTIAQKLLDACSRLGHEIRIAISDGPDLAAIFARAALFRRELITRVEPGKSKAALGELPLSSLLARKGGWLSSIDWLLGLGIRTIGDLQRLPRSALRTRFPPKEAIRLLPLLEGDDNNPLRAYVPPEFPEEQIELDESAHETDGLLFLLKPICERIAARLDARALSASRLDLELGLDAALLRATWDDSVFFRTESLAERAKPSRVLSLKLAAPIHDAIAIHRVLSARLESYELPAPVRRITLRVPLLERRDAVPQNFLEPESNAERQLPALLSELAAELGPANVGFLTPLDTWVMGRQSQLLPSPSACPLRRPPAVAPVTPARFFRENIPAPTFVQPLRRLFRIESVEWWTVPPPEPIEYMAAWVPEAANIGFLSLPCARDPHRRLYGWMW